MGSPLLWALLAAAPLMGQADARPAARIPLLVVLQDTGETREGLPVLEERPDAATYLAVLTRGFSGRMLRLFRYEQQWLAAADGRPVEPAYLLLSSQQGGFPRFGFWLGTERKADAGYVDLHRQQRLTGRFGAMDQIFPHELTHVIVRQLAGDPPSGGANQVHAVGVRTDPRLAFDEGFAEHVQILAVDDPGAAPETAALASDQRKLVQAEMAYETYRRALTARWSPLPPARVGFLFWFPQTEQVSRYHLVKENRFARQPVIPARLLERDDPYAAYLIDNTVPGGPDDPFRPTSRLLSTEGVVASLFWRWATSEALQSSYREPEFYEPFGVVAESVDPFDNVYLKLFAVLAGGRAHDTQTVIREYVAAFPDEAAVVDRLVRAVGLDLLAAPVPEIWMQNDLFRTGTSLFDQYRGLPRAHTFDLNAAAIVDLMSVDGVRRPLAEAILAAAPFASLSELDRVPGVTSELRQRFDAMARAAERAAAGSAEDSVAELGIAGLLTPLGYRVAPWLLLSVLASAWLYARMRTVSRARALANGFSAASIGLLATWVFTAALDVRGEGLVGGLAAILLASPAATPFLPLWLFGLPGAAWQLAWQRSTGSAARVLAAWATACLPAYLLTRSWF